MSKLFSRSLNEGLRFGILTWFVFQTITLLSVPFPLFYGLANWPILMVWSLQPASVKPEYNVTYSVTEGPLGGMMVTETKTPRNFFYDVPYPIVAIGSLVGWLILGLVLSFSWHLLASLRFRHKEPLSNSNT